ncbi:MAG: signal transduction protein, partial [Cyanobacteria bacterium J06559_3]
FYFDLALEHDIDLELARALDSDLSHDLDSALDLYLCLNLDLTLDHDTELELARALERKNALNLERARARALDLALDRDLDRARTRALDLIHNRDRNLTRTLDLAIARTREPELKQALQTLKAQVPVRKGNLEAFKQWWQTNGKTWVEKLRTLITQHRNIGHDWQFSDRQKEKLQQYYNANKLVVDCLNSDCYVTRSVRQAIEDTLLLHKRR